MAVSTNGSAKTGSGANGHIKREPGTSASSSSDPSTKPTKKQMGLFGVAFALATRIAVWYSIGTILLVCPTEPAGLTDKSPALCKPYLQVKAVTSPYTEPYYNAYVAPQVHKVQPYIDVANQNYITPATSFAKVNYEKYGAPQVDWAQKTGQQQWEANVVPQLALARKQASKQYEVTLGPHVKKVDDVIRPYYTGATTSATDFWELEIRPAYKFVAPYAQKGYSSAEKFTNDVVIPYSQQANDVLWTAVSRHVLPTVQVLYGENVEPQITRIKQRLGRYKDEKKIEAAADSVTSEPSPIKSASKSASSVASSASTRIASSTASVVASSSVAPPPAKESKSAAEQFSTDLKKWEQQVSRAASQGADHLNERVVDLCQEQHENQIDKVGKSLIVQLEEVEASGVKDIQKAIHKGVVSLPEEPTEDDVSSALKDIETKIRGTGKQVRDKAQQIRHWRKSFDTETNGLVEAAANSTLETIENIRDLRLQEIGRRWASHDRISHRDWASYNKLKKSPGEHRDSIAKVVAKHTSLTKVRTAAADVEEQAMVVAEAAAKELGRLRSVALWKLRAQDTSDNFESKIVPPVVAKVSEQISEKIAEAAGGASEAVIGTSQGTVESATSVASSYAAAAASSVSSAASSASEAASQAVQGSSKPVASSLSSIVPSDISASISSASSVASSMSTSLASSVSSKASDASSAASDYVNSGSNAAASQASVIRETASSLSSRIAGTPSGPVEKLQETVSQASRSASSVASDASARMVGTPSGPVDKLQDTASQVSKSAVSAASEASAQVVGTPSGPVEKLQDTVSQASKSASSAASEVSESVISLGGGSSSASPLSSASSLADDAASSASSLASSASSVVSEAIPDASTISSTASKATSRVFAGAMAQAVPNQQPIMDEPLPGHEDDESVVDSALRSAKINLESLSRAVNEAISGTPTSTGAISSASFVGSDLYSSALAAASSAIYGAEPTGTDKVVKAATEQYESAVKAASSIIYGTPKPVVQDAAEALQSRIEAYTSQANDKWSSAIDFAKSQSEIAKARVSQQVSGTPKPVHEEMYESVNAAYWDSLKAARSKYDAAIAQTTSIQNAALPPYASVSAAASSQLAAALSAVSDQYSKATSAAGLQPTPAHQSVLNEAQRRYYEGIGIAHDRYSSYMGSATKALKYAGLPVAATSTPVYESFLSKAQVQYAAASSAAQSALDAALASGSSVVGATKTSPAESLASAASEQYSSALKAASGVLYKTQTPAYNGMMSAAESRYSDLASDASSAYAVMTSAALSVAGAQPTKNAIYDSATDAASSQYSIAMAAINGGLARASSSARSAIYGTNTGAQASASSAFSQLVYGKEESWTEQAADQAKANWEAIVAAASSQVYGAPTPVYASITASASSVASVASSAADAQYSAIAALFSSVVSGQPPSATDAIFAQFSSAYYVHAPNALSSASSVASDAYASASSVVTSVFTPPATIDDILSSLTAQIDSAVAAASEGVYGTEKGQVEKATSAAAASASDVTATLSDAAEKANKAISEALFGPPTPTSIVRKATEGAGSVVDAVSSQGSVAYDAVSSQGSAAYDAVSSKVMEAFGAEKTSAFEGYQKQVAQALEEARRKMEGFATGTSETASEAVSSAKEAVQSVVDRVKDEL